MLNAIYLRYKNINLEQRQFLVQAFLSVLFRILAALSAFLFSIMISRLLGAEQSGLFFLALSLITLLSTLSLCGMDNALLRFIGHAFAQKNNPLINQTFTNAFFLVIPLSILIAIAVYFLAPFLAVYLFNKPEIKPTLSYFSLAIPFICLLLLNGYALQATRKVIASICSMLLGVHALCLISLLALVYLKLNLQINIAVFIYMASSVIVAILGSIFWFKSTDRQLDASRLSMPYFWKSAPSLWLISASGHAMPWVCILIVGSLTSAENVAYFTTALRTSLLISFMLTVINFVTTPRFSAYWNSGQLESLKKLAKFSTRLMIFLSLPILLIAFVWPTQIMMLFGDDFSPAAMPFIILCIGQSVNLMTGSVVFLLMMCGHEKEMRNITFWVGSLTIALVILLTSQWGIIGAAIAVSIGTMTQNLLAICKVKSRLGFWPI